MNLIKKSSHPQAIAITAFALIYGVALLASQNVSAPGYQAFSMLWLPTGLHVFAYFRWGLRALPWIWLADFFGNAHLLVARDLTRLDFSLFLNSALAATGMVIEAFLVVQLSRRLGLLPASADRNPRMGEIFKFLGLAVTPACAAGTILGIAAFSQGAGLPWPLLESAAVWLLGDILGIALTLPLLHAHFQPSEHPVENSRTSIGVLLGALLVATAVPTFLLTESLSSDATFLLAAALPLLLFGVTMFFPLHGTTLALLGIALLAFSGMSQKTGPLLRTGPGDGMVGLQLFMLVLSLTALAHAYLWIDHLRLSRRLSRMNEVLEQEVRESTRTLLAESQHRRNPGGST